MPTAIQEKYNALLKLKTVLYAIKIVVFLLRLLINMNVGMHCLYWLEMFCFNLGSDVFD